jgi:hypothetical protein
MSRRKWAKEKCKVRLYYKGRGGLEFRIYLAHRYHEFGILNRGSEHTFVIGNIDDALLLHDGLVHFLESWAAGKSRCRQHVIFYRAIDGEVQANISASRRIPSHSCDGTQLLCHLKLSPYRAVTPWLRTIAVEYIRSQSLRKLNTMEPKW